MVRSAILVAAAVVISAAASANSNSGNEDFMSRHYPPNALAKGEQGRVGFKIELTDEGRIEQCAITQSSGYSTLDRETCDFIVQYARFGAVRDTDGRKQRATKTGFIDWRLPPGVRKSSAPKLVSIALPPPLVCKRTKATGSNRANATHCMTDQEWKEQEQIARDNVERLQGRIFCGDHGCE